MSTSDQQGQPSLSTDCPACPGEPVLERMIAVAPMLQYLDANAIPHLVFVNKMDRSEVRYRDLLDGLRDLSGRPVVPHQYAIGRGDEIAARRAMAWWPWLLAIPFLLVHAFVMFSLQAMSLSVGEVVVVGATDVVVEVVVVEVVVVGLR